MRTKKALSTFYFAGIGLFIASAAYLWLRFDLTSFHLSRLSSVITASPGSSLLIAAMVYAVALTTVILRRKARAIEHPLTGADSYRFFYYLCPFVGAGAGAIAIVGSGLTTNGLTTVAAGVVLATAIVWIVIDPVITVVEFCGPRSRRLRRVRAVRAKAKRLALKAEKQRILEEARSQSTSIQSHWEDALMPCAQELADLVTDTDEPEALRRARAIDIALHASRMGGRRCMQYLYHMACKACREKTDDDWVAHNISVWWDGIGGWHSESSLTTTH
jgi:hypothetical protein